MSNETNIGGINISGISGGTIQTGDITTHITAGGDVVGGDKITYHGPTYPRPNYRNDIADLLNFYTQTFSGREQEWSQLLRFTTQETPGYLLIEALPGYGKSALMAQLVHRHETDRWGETPRPELIFFFIRHEGQRHTPVAFLQAVNSQLLTMLKLPGGVPPDLTTLRSQFSELWSQALAKAHQNKPLLLLVDGFDELAPDEVTIVHLLPANIAPYVHVVISSRTNPAPLRQVPLQHPCRQAAVIRLDAFDGDELRILLQQHGAADNLARALAPRVLAMTKGEPLFARFVCQEVAAEGESALARLEQNLPANVEAYFQQQLEQLKVAAKGKLARDILGLLLVTLGGITTEEIAEVLDASRWDTDEAIKPIQRFLLGEIKLELMHLQLRKVLTQQFGQRERKKYRQMLLAWCQSYQQQNWPKETPGYILAHYAQHLVEAEEHEALYALINKLWLDLKFQRTFSYGTFVQDVEQAIVVAEVEKPPNLVQVIRSCVIYATLVKSVSNVPANILGVMAQVGQAERARGYAALIPKGERRSKAFLLIGEALWAQGKLVEAEMALEQALMAAESISDRSAKELDLSYLAQAMAQVGNKAKCLEIVNRTLELVEAHSREWSMNYWNWKKGVLIELAQALIQVGEFNQAVTLMKTIWGDRTISVLSEVDQTLAQMRDKTNTQKVFNRDWAEEVGERENSYYRVEITGVVNQVRSNTTTTELTKLALDMVEDIEGNWNKGYALSKLALVFTKVKALDWALVVAELIDDTQEKIFTLSDIATLVARMGDQKRAIEVANRALVIAEANNQMGYQLKAHALGRVAQTLVLLGDRIRALKVVNQVLAVTTEPGNISWKQNILDTTAIIDTLLQVDAFDRALMITESIESSHSKILAMARISLALAKAGDKVRTVKLVKQVQAFLMTEKDDDCIAEIAKALALIGIFDQAVMLAEKIKDKELKEHTLEEIIEALVQVEEFDQALKVTKAIKNDSIKARALSKVAKTLAEKGVIDRALGVAESTDNTWQAKVEALGEIAHVLAQLGEKTRANEIANRALMVAKATSDTGGEISSKCVVAKVLLQVEAFDRALAVIEEVQSSWDNVSILSDLIPTLSQMNYRREARKIMKRLVNRILSEAKAMKDFDYVERGDLLNTTLTILIEANAFEFALVVAESFKHEHNKVDALGKVAGTLSQVGNKIRVAKVANRILKIAKTIEYNNENASALCKIAWILAQVEQSTQTRQILLDIFIITRLTGDQMFEILRDSTPALAALDQGETLWQVYQAVMEVESWRGMQTHKKWDEG